MSVLRFNALRGSALFVIESKLAYALVDNFFGGADRPYTKIEGKDFTPIELSIVRKVVDLAIEDLENAWLSVEKIDASFVRTEINPQFVGIVPQQISSLHRLLTSSWKMPTAQSLLLFLMPPLSPSNKSWPPVSRLKAIKRTRKCGRRLSAVS